MFAAKNDTVTILTSIVTFQLKVFICDVWDFFSQNQIPSTIRPYT